MRIAAAIGAIAPLLLAACDASRNPISQSLARSQIELAMKDSAAGWNTGDLGRFMRIYADRGDITFVSADGIIVGKAAIAKSYARSFRQRGRNTRGRLSFEFLHVRVIDDRHAHLIARYRLTRANGVAETGPTSLLFERQPRGWRVVADHSS